MSTPASPAPSSPNPLRNRIFLGFWVATLISNIGTWVHKVGESWLMTSLTPRPSLVALVAAAAMLPPFLLSIPAGALADVVDRRRLLIAMQLWMAVSATILAAITLMGVVTPETLLLLTAVLSVGDAVNGPAWAAVVPDLVSREELAAAISLNSVNFNIARAVGPAVGGWLVAADGPGFAFLVNAASFFFVVGVIFLWRSPQKESTLPPEQLWTAMRSGLRYVRHEPALVWLMARTVAFMWCGSALWALLPVLAKSVLHRDATGYGWMVGCLGVGAVSGAILLGRLGRRVSMDVIADCATVLFGLAMLGIGLIPDYHVDCALLLLAGAGWLALLSRLTIAVQTIVPGWVRARALSVHIFAFCGAYTIGSAAWGAVADVRRGPGWRWRARRWRCLIGWVLTRRISLLTTAAAGLEPSRHWPIPHTARVPHPQAGPVLVTIDVRVDPARIDDFSEAMRELGRLRRRDGAMRWGLWHDLAAPGHFKETFVIESWGQYMHQRERMTVTDRAVEDRAFSFHVDVTEQSVSHWISAYSKEFEEGEEATAAGMGVEKGV